MESLSYAFEGKGLFLPDDTNLPIDGLVRNRNLLQKWNGVDNTGFISNQFLGNSRNDTNVHSNKSIVSNSTISLNSSLKFDTNDETNGKRLSIGNSALSSPMSAKKARVTNLQSQISSCQVYGCNKDLSDAKDYHKRHKVCDGHSKASLVVVNGIQQRFCQQCSRFHIVAEFDEGKRSCRKRLAGHNERRRKPQFNTHFGSTFFRTDLPSSTSLFFSKILPNGFFAPQYNEPTNHIKLEEKQSQMSQLAMKFLQTRYPSDYSLVTPLPFQDLSSSSNSRCALSLLSAESHNLLPNSAGGSMGPIPEARFLENGLLHESNGPSQESNGPTLKQCMSRESGDTVDLVELSLHLQRVEQQRRNARVKMENGNVCDSMI